MSIRVAIIGMGHVGNTMHTLLSPHVNIVTYDVRQDMEYPAAKLAECSIGIVCVNTFPSSDGSCNISNVLDAATRLPVENILLKSTVPPGTTDHIADSTGKNVCFSPEYVGESTYYNPFWERGAVSLPFLILGGKPQVRARFIEFFLPILGPTKTYFQCSAIEAELIKYMENSYFAAKICFINEFHNICRAFNADWHTIREGWLLDPRISSDHTAVFKEAPGFAGKCLPNDLNAIVRASAAAGYDPQFLLEVLASNCRFRGTST